VEGADTAEFEKVMTESCPTRHPEEERGDDSFLAFFF
jgi:hypothetical protein